MKTMLIRTHRGGLDESIATMKTIPATLAAVREYMVEMTTFMFAPTEEELASVQVEQYTNKSDKRIPGWEPRTYLITYRARDGLRSPFGYCTELPIDEAQESTDDTVESNFVILKQTVQALLDEARNNKEKAKTLVETLIEEFCVHPHLDTWCFTKNIETRPQAAQRGYHEVVSLLALLRTVFMEMMSNVGTQEFHEIMTHFQNKGININDIYGGDNDLRGINPDLHYVQLTLDDGRGNIFIYNSDTIIGR